MPCYFPLHAFKAKGKDASKTVVVFKRSDSFRGERLDLPCGQCIGCRLERSRQWAVRCMHEASLKEDNCFVTLTYDDDHLPKNGSLVLSDFQNFMKRLRKSIAPKRVRFFHCGEYGERFGRPHYHTLLFGHYFEDRAFFSERNGHRLYTSKALSELWPHGFATFGAVTFESAAYVARYVLKKVTGEKAEEHYKGRVPEYITMSRRPGIGTGWFAKYASDVYPRDSVVVRGVRTRPPRFYDGLLGKEDPSMLALLKIDRERNGFRFVEDVVDGRIVKVSDTDGRRLLVKEEVKRAEVASLRRPLEGS